MLKLSFVICTTLSTPGFLIIDSICLDRYLLIENVMQLGFEVNILTWGLDVFCFSVRVHYCLISFHVHPEICPSCQNFQIELKKWKLFWSWSLISKNLFWKISLEKSHLKNLFKKYRWKNLIEKILSENSHQKKLIKKI